MQNKPHHALILGCGRSGTSIFGEFFQHLSPYTYYSEPPYADLKKYDYSQSIAIKVPNVSDGFLPTEGLSFPLADLLETIPSPRGLGEEGEEPAATDPPTEASPSSAPIATTLATGWIFAALVVALI